MGWIDSILAHSADKIALWVGAIFTFGIFSILYKENPYYRLCEHIFIGLATGLGVYITWRDVLMPYWWTPMVNQGQWWWALTVAGGAMYYFVYSKKYSWISRFVIAGMMGLAAGAAFQEFANTYFPMISSSFKPVIPTTLERVASAPGTSWPTAASNLIFVIVLATVMIYFFFSIDHRSRSLRSTASLGRWFLMFAFGAMFGATVMARMALFIGRIDFLTNEWGRIVPVWFWMALGGFLGLIIAYLILRPKPPKKLEGLPPDEPEPVEVSAGS